MYTLHVEWNQCRGIDSTVLLTVHDANNVCVDDAHVSRDCYESAREYQRAIDARKDELRAAWKIEGRTTGRGGY